eukprot:jgi/Tetstr1/458592/TSEL_044995.t1
MPGETEASLLGRILETDNAIDNRRLDGAANLIRFAKICEHLCGDFRLMCSNLHVLVCRLAALEKARGCTAREVEMFLERGVRYFRKVIVGKCSKDPERAFAVEVMKQALRYGHRRACVAAGGRGTRDEGVIREGDPGDFYMKVIAKKFRGVWHYGVITGVVTEWVLEDYGGATQWRAVFEDGDIVGLLRSEVVEAMAAAQEHPPVDADGEARLVTVHQGDDLSRSGKVTVQSGWVMEDCLHHMETFSILNAGPLLEEARVKAIMTEKELRVPRRWTRSLGRGGLDTQRGAKARRPGQRGAKARRPGQRGAKARRPGQRGAKARRPGQRGAKARRPGQRGAKARRPGQRGAKTAHTAESAERDALQAVDGSR